VPAVDDQEPVETLAADGADPPFDERVRAGRPYRCADDPDAVGAEHLVDRRCELAVAVVIKNRIGSARSTNVSMMFRACWVAHSPVGFAVMPARYTCRVASSMKTSAYRRPNSTVSTVKKSQATIPPPLGSQELPPCLGRPPRRGLDPRRLQDRPDSAGRDPDAEPGELALDPAVAPTRVLACQPHDQRTNTGLWSQPARPPMRIRPTTCEQRAVPATNRLRPHEQTAPPVTRKHPGQRGEDHPIPGSATRSRHLSPQHRQLVTQNQDFNLVRGL
jgi:hypothetical protein